MSLIATMSRKPFYDHECRRLRACQVLLMSLYGFRREAQTSLASLDAGGVHPENPRELLDVPHILRKLEMMRRYEGHFSVIRRPEPSRAQSR